MKTLYCGDPSVSSLRWLGVKNISNNNFNNWPQFKNRVIIGTYRGRTGIQLACQMLGIGIGHDVLVPAYNCGTEIDVVLASGANITGYRISNQCEIDLIDLMARKSKNTKAVYITHYFGWEHPMDELRRWCDEHGLFLIEDCALSLFSSGPSGNIGRVGDAAIFSFPKTLGLCHGGILSFSASMVKKCQKLAPTGYLTLIKEIQHNVYDLAFKCFDSFGLYGVLLSIRRLFRKKGQLPSNNVDFCPMPDNYYFNPRIYSKRAIHPLALNVAAAFSPEEIICSRRANYFQLARAVEGIVGVRPLYEKLTEGVCPLAFPLLVSDRDACVEVLQARGISAFPWWAGFHRTGIDWSQFPDACWLKRHLLTLPIHQGLNDRHLKYIAKTFCQLHRFSFSAE